MSNPTRPLQPLIALLRSCPTRGGGFSRATLMDGWEQLREQSLRHTRVPSSAIMAALVLSDTRFKELLTAHEFTQLSTLAGLALQRYQARTEPPDQIGKLINNILHQI
jgi:hypothetical protein